MPVIALLLLFVLSAPPVRAQSITPGSGDLNPIETPVAHLRQAADVPDKVADSGGEEAVAGRLAPPSIPVDGGAGVWKRPTGTIVFAGVVMLGQTMLIVGLVLQRRNRHDADQVILDRQAEMQRIQGRYQLATAAGAVGVWDWNFETNELFVDAVLKKILGFEDHEISTRPEDWGSRVHPDDVPVSAIGIKACFDGKTDVYETEHRMVHKDGGVKWMLSRGAAVRSADGSLRRLVGTKVDITQRKQTEGAILESQAALRRTNAEIQELAGRLIASQEVERSRLARDLHDDLSQQIAGLSIAISSFRKRLAGIPQAAAMVGEVSALQERAVELAEHIRRMSHDLHPSVLQHAGLVAALGNYCTEVQQRKRLAVTFSAEGEFESTVAGAALCLYRVAQEGLRNVVTHSRAGHAEVRLQRQGDKAVLTIADDGRGFDVVEAGKHPHGLGLVSITERVRLAGGTVSIVSEVNKGTRLHVQVPANGHSLEASWM
jgi:two-component system sensor histidine kinase UhpB